MHFDFDDAEVDYLHRLLLTRPMGEVEPFVLKVRQQVAKQQQQVAEKMAADAIRTASVPGDVASEGLPLP